MVDWVPQIYQGWKTKSALQRKGIGFMYIGKKKLPGNKNPCVYTNYQYSSIFRNQVSH